QYGQPGGFGAPPPPKKKRTGLWVGLSTGAVLVITFLITGLVAPGFLLGDDEGTTSAAADSGSAAPPPGGAPDGGLGGGPSEGQSAFPGAPPPSGPASKALVQDFIRTVNAGNGGAALGMICDE